MKNNTDLHNAIREIVSENFDETVQTKLLLLADDPKSTTIDFINCLVESTDSLLKERLEDSKYEFEDDKRRLEDDIEDKDNEITDLNRKCRKLEAANEQSDEELHQLYSTITNLEQVIREKDAEYILLQTKNNGLLDQLFKLKT